MGISKAKGFVRADRLAGPPAARLRAHRRRRAPGGPVLGVARPAANRGLRRDHRDRRPQQDPVGHLGRRRSATWATSRRRSRAFGWAVARCDGHDSAALARARSTQLRARAATGRSCSIADTVKGARRLVHGAARRCPAEHRAVRLPLGRADRRGVRAGGRRAARRALTERLAAARRATRRARGGGAARRRAPPAERRSGWSPPTARRWSTRGRARAAARRARRRPRARLPAWSRSASASRTASSSAASPSRTWSRRPARWRSPGCSRSVHSFACFLSTRAERADLQQRDRADEGHLRAARWPASSRAAPATRTSRCATSPLLGAVPGMALIEPYCEARGRALAVEWAVHEAGARSTSASSACPGSSASSRPQVEPLSRGQRHGRCATAATSLLRRRRAR